MMVALSPPPVLSSTIGWPLLLEEPINQKDTETSEYSFPRQVEVDTRTPSPATTNTNTNTNTNIMVNIKKFNHNASERDRRKKINTLYSSLRSLLPLPQNQMKKVSIPATISLVVKYIPELQQEVEGLVKKKEELLLRISSRGAALNKEPQREIGHHNSVCVVSTSRLNDTEAVIQISSYKLHKIPLSQILQCLEQDDTNLLLLNASSFETFEGRVFYHLHFQVGKSCRLESDGILTKKLLSIYEKKGGVF